ncbi:hypothetical protein LJR230_004116 [Trinickia sp. LjRoot230]|uniref:hypothetical protein n=1 Tax=Trinickia sp. LjRoot230 TaxID=3342288 RepID=UPI003ECF9A0C
MARRAEFDGMPVAVMTRTAGGGARFGIPGAALSPAPVAVVAIPTSREVNSYAASRGTSPVVVMPMPLRMGATLERIDEARREAREEEYTRRHEDLADRQEEMVHAQQDMLNAEMQMETMRAETRIVGMLAEITKEGFRNLADAAK